MRRLIGVVLASLAIALAACGSPAVTKTTGTTGKKTAAGFPVTVSSADGMIKIASRPKRILCLTPSGTQMLYAIGAGRQVVGVDKYSTYPANAPRTKFTGYESSAEDYLPLKPDLVILSFSTGTLVAQLKKLDLPTLLIPPAASVNGTRAELTELGKATGHLAAAKSIGAGLERYLRAEVRKADGHGKNKTYYLELDQTYYSATSKTFAGALFSLFGMDNIADAAKTAGSGYPQLSAEYVVKANPDYVFLADTVCCHQTASSFAARPGFGGLRAVREHHVVPVNDSVASEWGPHSLELFVRLIASVLAKNGNTTSSG
jgi:iron complex transport system substrate-binding protein